MNLAIVLIILQLIYSFYGLYFHLFPNMSKNFYVENKGVEPLTSCVQSRRSSQLS